MAKFFGAVGFREAQTETAPGVWTANVVERPYRGDVLRNTRQLVDASKVNTDLSVSNLISIVADNYANENIFAILYVEWAGTKWAVANAEVQRPRLLLTLGGVYNGPTPVAIAP